MIKINKVELELDLMDLDTAEKVEKELNTVAISMKKITSPKRIDVIKQGCEIVFKCFDNIFGEGTHEKIFGDKKNLSDCLTAFAVLGEQLQKQDMEFEKSLETTYKKYSSNRAQRRTKKK